MCEFDRNDVLIMARAILCWPVEYMDSDRPYYYCRYCSAEMGPDSRLEDFKHDLETALCFGCSGDVLTRENGETRQLPRPERRGGLSRAQ